ncbi:MAG: YdeI/OmpD-associated family protein [Acidobacteriota bacterium]
MPLPTFFATPADLRAWFEAHHEDTPELWVGFHKRATGKPSVTWPEAVDEALCFGWIDGVRKSLGEESYMIRFTPRRARSVWSAVNLRRIEELRRLGRLRPAGLRALEERDLKRSGLYSYESRPQKLDEGLEKELRANRRAWEYFSAQPPWYRRTAAFWVMSAQREETRLRRLATLIRDCAAGRRIGPLSRARVGTRPRKR